MARVQKIRAAKPGTAPEAAVGLWTPEATAAEFGVAVEVVAHWLANVADEHDHTDVRGGEVLTEGGRQRLRAWLDEKMIAEATAPSSAPNAAGPADAPTGPRREDLRLTRVFPWSMNILANRSNGLEVVVKVKSAKNLQAGMVLRDCLEGEVGCWFYMGKLPRTLGERQEYFAKQEGPPL